MLVTINTDASYHPDHKVGAFSFWMVSNAGRLFGAGQLKGKIAHTQEAEFKAVLNALHFLFDKSEWTGITKVIINTDCKPVVEMINGATTQKWAAIYKTHFNNLKRKHKVQIEARKVKAHSGIDEKRKWVNNWCDQQAKKIMRSSIKTINK